jgi:cytidylate kinase
VMLKLQRALGKQKNSVLEGRDIGTVVFPDADKKFYIDAKPEERVRRRYEELKASGQNVTLKDVEADLSNRDIIDSTREYAPLKKAEDAVYIDTSDLTIEQVVDKLINYIR